MCAAMAMACEADALTQRKRSGKKAARGTIGGEGIKRQRGSQSKEGRG